MSVVTLLDKQALNRYEIRGKLGHGSMGDVHLAFDSKLEREVAIKVISGEFAKHPRARERFHREARAIAQLKHPNIVEIFDYSGQEAGICYLVMERLIGQNLYNLLGQ